jgi:hypothetical protein
MKGCLSLLFLGAFTWVLTGILMTLLSWMLGFALTAGMITAGWLILIVLKLLF